ncbi:MAG: histidinol dehydrogenase [Firmicutes bacterium]|nr:histidinol dehydrogenase [Bacillota bacterium]
MINIPILNVDSKNAYLQRIIRPSLLDLADSLPPSNVTEPLFGRAMKPEETVRSILKKVKNEGDKGLIEIARVLDNFQGDSLIYTPDRRAYTKVSPSVLNAIRLSIVRVKDFHKRQLPQSFFSEEEGITLGWRVNGVKRAGLYVPGGTAPLVSSVIMTAVPAIIAGVRDITIATPVRGGKLQPEIEVAALELGIDKVLTVGGAQAIAALAFGTESVNKVDVIAGPGNLFVTLAKKEVYGLVGIDMLAGPSEIVVVADETADCKIVAADLLSQAEHDSDAAAVLVTTSDAFALKVKKELEIQLDQLPRKNYAVSSLENHGAIIVTKDLATAVEVVNKIAPEHLEVQVKDLDAVLPLVENAGAIFIGEYASEPLGDYILGPNHVLPTSGTARFSSPLSVQTFLKATSLLKVTKKGYEKVSKEAMDLAEIEGLDAHRLSVLRRQK